MQLSIFVQLKEVAHPHRDFYIRTTPRFGCARTPSGPNGSHPSISGGAPASELKGRTRGTGRNSSEG